MQTSQMYKKDKEWAHAALCDCKPQPPRKVRIYSAWLPGKAGITSNMKPSCGLIFLGSHPTMTEHSRTNWTTRTHQKLSSMAQLGAEHLGTQALHRQLWDLKFQWQDLLCVLHTPLYFSLEIQRHRGMHIQPSSESIWRAHTLLLDRHSFIHPRHCLVHLPQLAQ